MFRDITPHGISLCVRVSPNKYIYMIQQTNLNLYWHIPSHGETKLTTLRGYVFIAVISNGDRDISFAYKEKQNVTTLGRLIL